MGAPTVPMLSQALLCVAEQIDSLNPLDQLTLAEGVLPGRSPALALEAIQKVGSWLKTARSLERYTTADLDPEILGEVDHRTAEAWVQEFRIRGDVFRGEAAVEALFLALQEINP